MYGVLEGEGFYGWYMGVDNVRKVVIKRKSVLVF